MTLSTYIPIPVVYSISFMVRISQNVILAFISELFTMLHFQTNCWISLHDCPICTLNRMDQRGIHSPPFTFSLVALLPAKANLTFTSVPSIYNSYTFFRLFGVIFNSLFFMSNSQEFTKIVYFQNISQIFSLSYPLPITILKFIFHLHNYSSPFSDLHILYSVAFLFHILNWL